MYFLKINLSLFIFGLFICFGPSDKNINHGEHMFVCPPCGCAADSRNQEFKNDGTCPHCGMNLVEKTDSTKNKNINNVKIKAKKGNPVVVGTTWTIHSQILDENRKLLIHLPSGYANSNNHYPVLYMLDGGKLFEPVVGIVQSLSRAAVRRIPKMIVVGIVNTNRARDFTPPTDKDALTLNFPYAQQPITQHFSKVGGASNFFRFLTEEVAPFLKEHYRIAPFRILAGHSLGGLFTVHTLLKHPQSFNGYISISPSLYWNNSHEIKYARSHLNGLPLDNRFLFLTAGVYEGKIVHRLARFRAVLKLKNPQEFHWWYKIISDANHHTTPHLSMYYGLKQIFSDWYVSQAEFWSGSVKRLKKNFRIASKSYGYNIKPPEWLVNRMGYFQLGFLNNPNNASKLFALGTKLYPQSPNAYDSMSDALVAQGQFKKALKYRRKAVKIAAKNDSSSLEFFKHRLNMLKQKIKENSHE